MEYFLFRFLGRESWYMREATCKSARAMSAVICAVVFMLLAVSTSRV